MTVSRAVILIAVRRVQSSQDDRFLTHLVVPASFLDVGQADDGFTVLYGLVEDGVGAALDRLLLSYRSAVVLLHLPPLDRL